MSAPVVFGLVLYALLGIVFGVYARRRHGGNQFSLLYLLVSAVAGVPTLLLGLLIAIRFERADRRKRRDRPARWMRP